MLIASNSYYKFQEHLAVGENVIG